MTQKKKTYLCSGSGDDKISMVITRHKGYMIAHLTDLFIDLIIPHEELNQHTYTVLSYYCICLRK